MKPETFRRTKSDAASSAIAPAVTEPAAATLSRAPEAPETLDVVVNEPVATAPAPVMASVDAPEATGAQDTDGLAQLEQPRGAHVMRGEAPTDEPRGSHLMKGDPFLSVERRALHAKTAEGLATPELSTFTPNATLAVCGVPNPAVKAGARTPERKAGRAVKRAARTTKRQGAHATVNRRWGLVPVVGAAGALVVGLGGGGAFAFITTYGSGAGQTTAGSPVTVQDLATTGTADLLPGRAGAAYFILHNTNSFGATFDQVAPGATVVSDNTGLCASSDISIAQTLPYSFSPAVTVSPGGTSGIQSIPSIVELAPNAPGTCQGVTFTVTLALSGKSS
ncbi:MAG: hypothetical protein ACLQCU_15175 [Acidimicrobiales bacterium]